MKISMDFDLTLNTRKGKELAKQLIKEGNTLYVISARSSKSGIREVTNSLGILNSRVFAVGSNTNKIKKIKELEISKHYDDNKDVIDKLGKIGILFTK